MNGGGENTTPTTFNNQQLNPKSLTLREKEKERTKLRERHRRAITSRMLSGLRQYGNFPLPARADMNDVLAALAREAGWLVEPDGTTYRPSPPPSHLGGLPVRSAESPLSASSLKNCSTKASLDCQPSVLGMDENLSPASLDSVVVTEMETKSEKYTSTSNIDSPESLEAHQLIQDVQSQLRDYDYSGTPHVPVYSKLSSGIINNYCQLVDPEGIRQELKHLKSLNVDGVVVDCWWGIVEGWSPQKYTWLGYRELFMILHEFQLKVQVALAFHEYGGSDSGNVFISLPHWFWRLGRTTKTYSSQIVKDGEILNAYHGVLTKNEFLEEELVYFDFMRSFRSEFDDLFGDGLITAVEVGLGASGELKFPSFPERLGWRYPGVGEFQCYDRYLQQDLRKAAKLRGHSFWARALIMLGIIIQGHPKPVFSVNEMLIDHADNLLSLATLAFEETHIVVKIPAVYWWYRTPSHAAELTAGYYNPTNRDGYLPVFEILRKHSVTMKFVCPRSQINCQDDESFSDPEGLSWQVLNSAWDCGLTVAGQNADPCFDKGEHIRMVETSKPSNDPDRRHFSFFSWPISSKACTEKTNVSKNLPKSSLSKSLELIYKRYGRMTWHDIICCCGVDVESSEVKFRLKEVGSLKAQF
ncbi:Beta-amylase 8 [Bienertia sinuspersici]